MLALVTLVVLALAAMLWRIGGELLFPPALFATVWGVTLTAICAATSLYYPVGEAALTAFLLGTFAFAVGGVIARYAAPPIRQNVGWAYSSEIDGELARRTLDVLLCVLLAGFPYYYSKALQLAGGTSGAVMLQAIRQATVAGEGNDFGFLAGNLNVLAGIVAMAMVWELDGTWGRRLRGIVAVLLAITYSVLTGSKQALVLIVTLLCVRWVRSGGKALVRSVPFAILALGLFLAGLLTINYAQRSFDSTADAASLLGITLLDYWLGGVVAFQEVINAPQHFASSQSIGRFFFDTLVTLGVDVEFSARHMDYVPIGDERSTNVYTIYVSYFPDFGWAGVFLGMLATGFVLTLVWAQHRRHPVLALMYAKLGAGLVFSFHAERFITSLNGLTKTAAVLMLVYWFVPEFNRLLRWKPALC